MEHVGRQLAAVRKARGLTQTQLAERAETSQSAICRVECSEMASVRTLRRIAEALDADLVLAVVVRYRGPHSRSTIS